MDKHDLCKITGSLADKNNKAEVEIEKLLKLVELQATELAKQRRKIRSYRKWIEVQCPN